MTQNKDDPYSGIENLEIMREAVKYNRFLLDTVCRHAPSNGLILDFGAGTGQFAIPMANRGFNITAVEPDTTLRQGLLANGIDVAASTKYLPDLSIDYAYTLNVLEHIDDDIGALRQLHSKLTANGTLLIYVPAFPLLYSSMDARVGHVRRYSRKMLIDSVLAAGFSIEKASYVDFLGFFATLAFKFLGGKSGNVNQTTITIYDRLLFPASKFLDTFTHCWLGKNLLLLARKKTNL